MPAVVLESLDWRVTSIILGSEKTDCHLLNGFVAHGWPTVLTHRARTLNKIAVPFVHSISFRNLSEELALIESQTLVYGPKHEPCSISTALSPYVCYH
jgi:hypothetical protein